ncbi:LCP family protein [Streptomyces sp. NPDC057702]|uniref:LCP family protein n=1 Tax=unclassified Streptomyces TaxID=2593676 RepID=UPI00368F0E1A
MTGSRRRRATPPRERTDGPLGPTGRAPGPAGQPSGRAAARAATRAAGRTGRRSRRRRGRLVLGIVLALVVVIAAGAGWIYLRLNANIETFDADGIADHRPPAAARGENVLVIGSDARTDGNSELGGGDKGDVGRSDTAFLLHVYGDREHAVAISIPRDTLVDIPPCRLPDGTWTAPQPRTMFNAAYSVGQTAKGNPACTQNTVEKLTGLRVDHTLVIDFKGFAKLTDVVGGVDVCLPQDVYEKDLNPHRTTRGKRLFAKGEQRVAGQRALDYVRIRHGIGDGSDIGRIKRQQAFVGSLFKKVKSDGLTPTKVLPLADAATRSMTVDPGLGSVDKLASFALSLKNVDLHHTKFRTLPWRYEGARVAVVEPEARALWDALRHDRTLDGADASGKGPDGERPTPTPSTAPPVSGAGIAVAVYNGTSVPGLAADVATLLRDHDFTVTGTATGQGRATTAVEYGPGQRARAQTVARLLPGAELRPGSGPGLSVLIGQDHAERPSPTPTTEPPTPPAHLTKDVRAADDDLCADLSYG